MHVQTHTHSVRGDLQVSTLPSLLPAAHWYLLRSGFITGVGSHASYLFSRQETPGSDCPVASRLCCACQRSGRCSVSPQGTHQILTTAVFTSRSTLPLQIEILLLCFLSSLFLCFKSWCNSFIAIYSSLWSSTSLTLCVWGGFVYLIQTCCLQPHTCLSRWDYPGAFPRAVQAPPQWAKDHFKQTVWDAVILFWRARAVNDVDKSSDMWVGLSARELFQAPLIYQYRQSQDVSHGKRTGKL